MRSMKRIFLWVLCVGLVMVVLAGGALMVWGPHYLRPALERALSEKLGGMVRMGELRLPLKYPLQMQIMSLEMETSRLQARLKALTLEAQMLSSIWSCPKCRVEIKLHAKEGDVQLKAAVETEVMDGDETQKTWNPPLASRPSYMDTSIALELSVEGVVIRGLHPFIHELHIERLKVDHPHIFLHDEPWRIALDSRWVSPHVPFPLPVSVLIPQLKVGIAEVSAPELEVALLGLSLKGHGVSRLDVGDHRWAMGVLVQDLAKLPLPLPESIKSLKGSLKGQGTVVKTQQTLDWKFDLKPSGVQVELDGEHSGWRARGPVELRMQAQAHGGLKDWALPDIHVQVDATQAEIQYKPWLNKPKTTPMRLSMKGKGSSTTPIQLAALAALEKLSAQMTAEFTYPLQDRVALSLEVPLVELAGMEKFFPVVGNWPLKGQAQLKAQAKGAPQDLKRWRVHIEQLRLRDVRGQLKYTSADESVQVDGPFQIDLNSKLNWEMGKVKRAEVVAISNFDQMRMHYKKGSGSSYQKAKGEPLQLKVNLTQAGENYTLGPSHVRLPFARLTAQGFVDNSAQVPQMKAEIKINDVQLSQAAATLNWPMKVVGSLTGDLKVRGPLDTVKTWNQWPLVATGQLQVNIPSFVYKSATSGETPQTADGKTNPTPSQNEVQPQPLLPPGDLWKGVNVGVGVQVGQLTYEKEKFAKVQMMSQLSRGQLSGTLTLEAFAGQLQVSQFLFLLTEVSPLIEASFKGAGLDIQRLLMFMSPDYKGWAEGRLNFEVQNLKTKMPSDPQWLKTLALAGSFVAKPLRLHTVQLKDVVERALEGVPGVGRLGLKAEPMNGEARSGLEVKKEKLQLTGFEALDVSGSALYLDGSVGLDQTADLSGRLHLKDVAIKGCLLEANQDAQGRWVVPLHLKGSILKSRLNIAKEAVREMGQKALECEGKKLLKKTEDKVKDRLESEVKGRLKSIFGK